jgi:hypothetical protein
LVPQVVRGPAAVYALPPLSDTEAELVLLQMAYTTIKLPTVLPLLNARLFVVPEVTSFARTWTNCGVAGAALAGGAPATTSAPTAMALAVSNERQVRTRPRINIDPPMAA